MSKVTLSILALISAAFLCTPLANAQSAGDAKTKQATDQMNKMDVNKDSTVTKEEYMKYQEQKFDAMDKDKNKALSQQEWLQRQLQESDGSSY